MKHDKRQFCGALALAALGLATGPAAHAQEFPSRPVRLITPFPVGSGPDGLARLLADRLSRAWGKSVIVENRPGGNGFVAIDAFKRGATDGHDMIQLDNVHLTAYPHLFKKLPYDPARDFDVLLPLNKAYFLFTTAANSPYRNLKDLIADAKARPGQLNYGSWSVGNPVHLGSARFAAATGTDMVHLVFKETSQLYTSVANGDLSFAMGSSGSTLPLYQAGKIRYLAVAAPHRLAALPEVPTMAEAGGPSDFEVSGWTALALPPGLPAAVTEKVRRDVAAALTDPAILAKYTSFGYEPFVIAPAAFGQYIRDESATMGRVIQQTRASLD
ncbi:tripartite tricarboxylate transporter substrate binding protein [Xylophilus rhododendri]|uniref:Tripartite tricarboxylate transporter substrate binding protein n=1 Tax=Xylophilus rhododendri TaxID=2697032 RepID=A0A857J3H7_9BURK|nr:tripartite tricarboxylate transporter substrate binding protein [Xylophilus rhododendri]QHI98474.1 tripartite tricarboxylate transporter substrate binding protein [Xylophilus rhododendri]